MWGKRTEKEDFIEEKDRKKDWRPRVNYYWIVNHIPFLLFLFLLATMYIANGHYAVKNIRKINGLKKTVKELNWDYLKRKSELMFRSKMSEVSDEVAPYGLKEAHIPPLVIQEENNGKQK